MTLKRAAVKRKYTQILLVGLLIIVIFKHINSVPATSQIVGIYEGSLLGVSETINIGVDGKFTQTLKMPSGEKWMKTGNWNNDRKVIYFDKYLHFYGTMFPKRLVDPPEDVSLMHYVWRSNMLINDWDSGELYVLRKQK